MVNAHVLRHGEVIVQGDAVKARHVANQLALRAAVEKHGVGKIFTFHRSVASAASFVGQGNLVPKLHLGTHLSSQLRLRDGAMESPGQVRSAMELRNEGMSGESIANHLPDFGCFHVSGAMPTAEREAVTEGLGTQASRGSSASR